MSLTFTELLTRLRKKCGMYIGQPSIIRFAAFLLGYFYAFDVQNIEHEEYTEAGKRLYNFNKWLAIKYNIKDMLGWDSILLQVTENDKKAWELFWKEWDEFSSLEQKENNNCDY
jgi:hypothetical protein